MHPRKRADWPLTVYRYWVRLDQETWADLPIEVKHEAEAMRALWNRLVAAFAHHQAAYEEIRQAPSAVETDGQSDLPYSPSQNVQHLRESYVQEIRQLTATCPAAWANSRFVLTQFQAAVSRHFKRHGNPPRPKTGTFHEVHFCHQFTEGGLPVERIFGQGRRLHLEPVPPEAFHPTVPQRQRKRFARTSGVFQVGPITLPFKTILHRPLPTGAYLKTATLVGKQITPGGYHIAHNSGHSTPPRWLWSLHLTVESPPTRPQVPLLTRAAAALQLEATLWEDTQLRLGTLSDATGREEPILLPEEILHAWRHKRVLQSQATHYLEEVKSHLHNHPERSQLPLTAQRMLTHLEATGAPGLWRLFHIIEQARTASGILDLLRAWADRSTIFLREARGVERHLLGHRDWFYHNLANDLCRRYQQISLVGSTSASIGTETASDLSSYRHLLAPSRFVTFLRQAAEKTGTEVQLQSPPPHSRKRGVRTKRFEGPSSAGRKLNHIVKPAV